MLDGFCAEQKIGFAKEEAQVSLLASCGHTRETIRWHEAALGSGRGPPGGRPGVERGFARGEPVLHAFAPPLRRNLADLHRLRGGLGFTGHLVVVPFEELDADMFAAKRAANFGQRDHSVIRTATEA